VCGIVSCHVVAVLCGAAYMAAGVTAQMIAVRELPPSAGSRILVSLESLYGMWAPLVPSLSLEMTLPRMSRDLLIWPPSLRRTPSEPVKLARSLPAKSTRFNEATRIASSKSSEFSLCRYVRMSTALSVRFIGNQLPALDHHAEDAVRAAAVLVHLGLPRVAMFCKFECQWLLEI